MSEETKSPEDRRIAIDELKKKLERLEAKTVHGAPSLQPKTDALSMRGLEEANPDRHFRRVNVADRDKADRRVDQGYVATPEDECREHGVRHEIGGTRVMSIPREVAEERRRAIDEETTRRLSAHKADVLKAAESVARELRDKHGISVPLDRLLVDE